MPAKQKPCDYCTALFWATRSDARFCSRLCCNRAGREDARFEMPTLPQSGVAGVTFNRYTRRWTVKICGEYWDSFEKLEDALRFCENHRTPDGVLARRDVTVEDHG